jgi:folate-binding protein YgfZ
MLSRLGLTATSASPSHDAMTIATEPCSGRLAHLGVLRFTGPDSVSFLQGQVSNDTRRLTEGAPLLAAYSSPQGRVLALLHLLPHSTGIVAILPRELVLPTFEALRKFVLRAKVKIEDASEQLSVSGQHGTSHLRSAGIAVPENGARYVEIEGVGVGAVSRDGGRYWVIGPPETLAKHGLAGELLQADQIAHEWRLADIRTGLPQIYLATREAFVAQMLNLDLLDGISFSKGCYTGQEIIARTQHLGRIKRRLYRLQLPLGEWSVGQALRLTDGRTGRLTEVVRSGDGFEALAVLNKESGEGESAAAESAVAATQLPLSYEV